MLLNKENLDPDGLTGILKRDKADYEDFEGDTTRFRRRVSFAPEVTLHKIDVVDQNRRQTIGFAPDSSTNLSRTNSSDSNNLAESDMSNSAVPAPAVPVLGLVESSDEEEEGEEMEFTEQINIGAEMELTQSLARVEPVGRSEPTGHSEPTGRSEPEAEPAKTSASPDVPTDESHEEPMELTQSLPVFKQPDSAVSSQMSQPQEPQESQVSMPSQAPLDSQSAPDTQLQAEPEEMELTQQVSNISSHLSTINESDEMESSRHISEMDLTQVQSVIKTQPEKDNQIPTTENEPESQEHKSPTQPEEEMEVTKPISSIKMIQPESSSQELGGSEEMDITQPVSTINPPETTSVRSSMEVMPQFPDIEIPVPEEISNKRFSDYDDQSSKRQKSESPKIYRNYRNVSLSQFLTDLGIKFFDDIELDDVSQQPVPHHDGDAEFSLSDYCKANNKLLMYSLYDFSNQDLSKNIVEGRKVYEQLDDSILNNNPLLFKEFYASNLHEQESLKSDYSLIQEHCKFEAKEKWYNWRIQLVENLIVKFDLKYDLLLQDKQKFQDNLVELQQEIESKTKYIKLLSVKLSVILRLKQKFGNDDNQLNEMKQKLSNCKQDILQLRNEIETKSNQLINLTNEIKNYDEKITKLKQEIETNQHELAMNKKFSVNDTRLLNLNFKLMQELSNIEYLGKVEGYLTFKYQEFELKLNNQDFRVDVLSENFYNSWIYPYLIKMIESTDGTPLERFEMAKFLIDKFIKIDKEVFKISIKFPTVPVDSDEFSFKTIFCKFNEFKVILTFTSDLDNLSREPIKFKLLYEIVKGSDQLGAKQILEQFITQCHVSNEILNNASVY